MWVPLVFVCVCVCVCTCTLGIVSRDKILRFIYTLTVGEQDSSVVRVPDS